MLKSETKEYLKELYDSIKEVDNSILKFKIALHNLDKLRHNIDSIKKLLDDEQVEFYKLKTGTNNFIKEKLKIWHKIEQMMCYNIFRKSKGEDEKWI